MEDRESAVKAYLISLRVGVFTIKSKILEQLFTSFNSNGAREDGRERTNHHRPK
jgi:hypothetical protein